jgi:hypothetical protein
VAVVVGTGGTDQYSVSKSDPEAGYLNTFSGENRNMTYGVLDVRVTPTSLQAAFINARTRDREDEFSITAGSE